MRNANIVKSDRGQTIVIFALILPILILFAGLAIDVGLLYVTKAKLSTSVDAACLTGMKNLTDNSALTQAKAAQLATDMFQANFGPNPPTPGVSFPLDTYGNQQVKVTATANVRTLFMQYLQQWSSVPVSAAAVATRGKLIMSIVLDRSGSMSPSNDNGETALQAAVPIFVSYFNNSPTGDELAMISFSSNATVDFAMNYLFATPIDNAVAAMNPVGGTFGTGAGTGPILSNTVGPPLSLADLQNNSVTINPGENVIKVVVYFTDGLMNTVQDKIYCLGKGGNINNKTFMNYGGEDAPYTGVYFFDPTKPADSCSSPPTQSCWGSYGGGGFPYDAAGDICKDINGNNVTTFTPQQGKCGSSGTLPPCSFTRDNVTTEAQYRAIQTAIAMRTESPVPTYIFTIGLGTDTTATALLKQLANDPTSPSYILSQPQGEFFYIQSCTGSGLANCKTELNTAFQAIASKILLRLTQ
ncbi:MAG: pilus assembly protein TadG-related protein [Candidatus Korobacteraceae bacterium]